MLIFSGSSNKNIAKKLAKELKIRLGKIELSRFANDEARVWIKEKKVGRKAVVVQSLSQPTDHHLIEFCLICDALKRKGVKEIIGVIPWLGYSKQDKVFREGESLSVKVIAKMLQVAGLEKIVTFDLHNLAILGFFDIPLINLSANQLFIEHFKSKVDENTIVVAPDAGAVKSSSSFAQKLGVDVTYIDKKRDLNSGKVMIKGVSGKVKGKNVLIVDDMLATGETLIETAKFLKKEKVQSIKVAVTHHLYVDGVQEKIDKSKIDELMVTDTVKQKDKSNKLKIISVVGMLAKEF